MNKEKEIIDKILVEIRKDCRASNIPLNYSEESILINGVKRAIQLVKYEEIKWLQSILDTKHISNDNRWIIEGRISKLEKNKNEQTRRSK